MPLSVITSTQKLREKHGCSLRNTENVSLLVGNLSYRSAYRAWHNQSYSLSNFPHFGKFRYQFKQYFSPVFGWLLLVSDLFVQSNVAYHRKQYRFVGLYTNQWIAEHFQSTTIYFNNIISVNIEYHLNLDGLLFWSSSHLNKEI